MSTYLVYLNTQSLVWDYVQNRQWLEAHSMRIAYTNDSTVHAVLIAAAESEEEICQMMDETLREDTDDFAVIPVEASEVEGLGNSEIAAWLAQRPDWQKWRATHR